MLIIVIFLRDSLLRNLLKIAVVAFLGLLVVVIVPAVGRLVIALRVVWVLLVLRQED